MTHNISEPAWESEDAISFRAFLESKHGARFMARLSWLRPDHSTRKDATERLVESGLIEGYEMAIKTILIMQDEARPIKEEYPTDYPNLDDDAAWDDAAIAKQNSTTT